MIEFRKDKGPWSCNGYDDCVRLAAAIVEDGRWWFIATCDNEQHIAEALAEHEEAKAGNIPLIDKSIDWADVNNGARFDGATWDWDEVA